MGFKVENWKLQLQNETKKKSSKNYFQFGEKE